MALTLAELLTLATGLADAVTEDINAHGGLTSSDTIRAADVLRLEISRFKPNTNLLNHMTDEERLEVFAEFCTHCGGTQNPCYCMRDE